MIIDQLKLSYYCNTVSQFDIEINFSCQEDETCSHG